MAPSSVFTNQLHRINSKPRSTFYPVSLFSFFQHTRNENLPRSSKAFLSPVILTPVLAPLRALQPKSTSVSSFAPSCISQRADDACKIGRPRCSSIAHSESFLPQAISTWNDLPCYIVTITCPARFCDAIYRYLSRAHSRL